MNVEGKQMRQREWSIMLRSILLVGSYFCVATVAFGENDLDLARFAPNDAGFYAEFHGLAEIRSRFESMGIWHALRDVTEGDESKSERWHRQTEQSLGMTGDELIHELVGHRAAIFSTTPADWQDGVIIAELESPSKVQRLLRRWGVKVEPS